MANRCANTAATRILYLREKAVLREKNVLNQVIAVLRRSIGLPGGFVTVWENRTRHTTTVTLWRMRAKGYQPPIGGCASLSTFLHIGMYVCLE